MAAKSIRIMLAGNASEAQTALATINSAVDSYEIIRCVDVSAAVSALSQEPVDVILLNLSLPGPAAFGDLAAIHAQTIDVPIIVCADVDDQDLAVKAIQEGAQDYLVKSQIDRSLLSRSIKYAIERQRMLTELKFALASEKILMEELDKKNRELVELSITDGLTGLYNHRFIQERFDFEFKRARRYHTALSCMLLDIDHFKQVNDTHGHQFGDYVLIEIAGILKSNSREVDICGRYGGEEFMVITNQVIDDAMRFASKLHAAVDSHVFARDGKTAHVTVSIGVADFKSDLKARQELIERADTALYWAKRDGRNIIRQWKEFENDGHYELDQLSIEGLKQEFTKLSNEVRATYMESANALVNAIDAKDHYTKEHLKNVSHYAVELAAALGLPDREIEIIKYAGLLHDIGKIGINQEILTKKSKVTQEEFEILKKHPVIGANILKDVKFLEKEIPIILHHHERWDGKGYPHGLSGREIPPGARILAVVDAFDAMTTDRVYQRKLSLKEAMNELSRCSGSQFAPDMVEQFLILLRSRDSVYSYAEKFARPAAKLKTVKSRAVTGKKTSRSAPANKAR